MQHPRSNGSVLERHAEEKPHPSSHDSGSECSLDHWLEVYWLVEEEYAFAKRADSEQVIDEETIEVTVLASS